MTEHALGAEVYSLVLHRVKAKRDAEVIRDAVKRMAKSYAAAQVAELEARNAALVAALKRLTEVVEELFETAVSLGHKGTADKLYWEKRYAWTAIEANKKGEVKG